VSFIVDNFAGGGGASTGIELALGRSPDIAVNHDPFAIAMHSVNHPSTHHLCGDVWDVDPVGVCKGEPVDLAWFSPDCKHHSKAKGGKPRDSKIRALAWVVVRWARAVKPRVIILENVEEFADWGPLDSDGYPDPKKKGWTFRRWWGSLKAAGYDVEMRELRACDYGAPTTRKRLFVIARCDGDPIVWPTPTHGPGRPAAWRTAAECIDWSLPCPSIFGRKKPLAEKTLRRIARGIQKFVIDNPRPFIVPTAHAGDARVHSIDEPLRTITGGRRGDHALVAPTLVQTGYGERPATATSKGQEPRILDLHAPLGTVVGCGQKHGLVAAFLAKHNGGHEATGSRLDEPMHTVTAKDHHSLAAAYLMKYYGTGTGVGVDKPAPTVTAGAEHLAQVRAFLARYNGDAIGQQAQLPLGAITTARRFGLVMVHGEPYAIADIGMRMLQPRELFRAQGFPDSYVIDRTPNNAALTKTVQIRCCGNSVCPPLAAALVRANVVTELEQETA
jgi:DNA (cytosine-5)-methyltransferase 1